MTFVRRAVIFVAQILALISIVVATIGGALAGEGWLVRVCRLVLFSCLRLRAIYRRRPRRLLHFDNSGGAIFFVRRNRDQHAKSIQ